VIVAAAQMTLRGAAFYCDEYRREDGRWGHIEHGLPAGLEEVESAARSPSAAHLHVVRRAGRTGRLTGGAGADADVMVVGAGPAGVAAALGAATGACGSAWSTGPRSRATRDVRRRALRGALRRLEALGLDLGRLPGWSPGAETVVVSRARHIHLPLPRGRGTGRWWCHASSSTRHWSTWRGPGAWSWRSGPLGGHRRRGRSRSHASPLPVQRRRRRRRDR